MINKDVGKYHTFDKEQGKCSFVVETKVWANTTYLIYCGAPVKNDDHLCEEHRKTVDNNSK